MMPPVGGNGGADPKVPPKTSGGGSPMGSGGQGGMAGNCGDIDFFGECTGDMLAWCSGGTLVERDCAAESKICAWVDDRIGNNCVDPPDPCMGLTIEGECVGSLLRYCLNEMINGINCADDGRLCAFDNNLMFYNCIDAPPP